MSTYLVEDKVLFSGDFFGSHYATDSLFVEDEAKVVSDAKRYYAEIMMPFRSIIKKNIETIQKLSIDFIAPSHGPVYNRPALIVDAYVDWISERVENKVLLVYVSMHGSTETMVNYVIDKLMANHIRIKPFNLTRTDLGELAMEVVDTATIMIATPTVLAGPHPLAVYAASLLNALKPKARYASVIGSYGWGGRTVDVLKANLSNLKVELLEPVLFKGHPKGEDFQRVDVLIEQIKEKHQQLS
jgi:flavorubredoxin